MKMGHLSPILLLLTWTDIAKCFCGPGSHILPRRFARQSVALCSAMSAGENSVGSAGEKKKPSLHPATVAAQTTGAGAETQYDGIVPAIYPASTYLRDVDLSYPKGKCYSRADNPTVLPAESTLCRHIPAHVSCLDLLSIYLSLYVSLPLVDPFALYPPSLSLSLDLSPTLISLFLRSGDKKRE